MNHSHLVLVDGKRGDRSALVIEATAAGSYYCTGMPILRRDAKAVYEPLSYVRCSFVGALLVVGSRRRTHHLVGVAATPSQWRFLFLPSYVFRPRHARDKTYTTLGT